MGAQLTGRDHSSDSLEQRPITHNGNETNAAAIRLRMAGPSGRAAPGLGTAGRKLSASTNTTTVEPVVARAIAPPLHRDSEHCCPIKKCSDAQTRQTSVT